MKNLLLPFFVVFAFAASAQIEETLKNAAKSKMESQDFNSQRSNKERNMMDNGKKRSAPAQSSPAPPSPGSAAPEPADSTRKKAPADATSPVMTQTPASGNAYTFNQKITYTMDDPSKPDKEKTSMTYYYGENALMNTMPEQEMATIYNYTDETMTTINEKGKTATIMSARWINGEIEKAASDVTVTKTGQTKVILGYNCEEYVIQDAKNKSVCWMTKEIAVDYTKSLQVMSKSFSKSYAENFDGQGIAMEITTYDKKGEATSHMIMTEFKEEVTVKDLAGYTVTSLVMH